MCNLILGYAGHNTDKDGSAVNDFICMTPLLEILTDSGFWPFSVYDQSPGDVR